MLYGIIGFIGGIIFVSMFWWKHVEDQNAEILRLRKVVTKHIKNWTTEDIWKV